VHRNRFIIKQPTRSTNYPNIFCYKTLHVSGIFFAHHQAFSTVNAAMLIFVQVLMTSSKHSQEGRVEFYNRINLGNQCVWLVT